MNDNTNEEIWKDVEGYEGLYKISNLGNIYSLYKNKIMKWKTNNRNYRTVGLVKNGKYKYFLVHRLVALHFIPNQYEYPQVNHKDENKDNNCADNLEWCTNHYNALYGSRVERTTNNPMYQQSREKMKRKVIGYPLNGGKTILLDSIKDGALYGFSRSGINECCRGKKKSHKGYAWKYAE